MVNRRHVNFAPLHQYHNDNAPMPVTTTDQDEEEVYRLGSFSTYRTIVSRSRSYY